MRTISFQFLKIVPAHRYKIAFVEGRANRLDATTERLNNIGTKAPGKSSVDFKAIQTPVFEFDLQFTTEFMRTRRLSQLYRHIGYRYMQNLPRATKNRVRISSRRFLHNWPFFVRAIGYRKFMKTFLPLVLSAFCFGAIAAEKNVGIGQSFKGPIGLQMYSLRFYSPSNLVAKLDKVKEWGIKTIEGGSPARGMSTEEFLKLLDERGIKLVSTGADYNRLKNSPDEAVSAAKKLGAKYVMCAWIPHKKGEFNEQNAREAIDVFNNAGKKFKEAGITFTYHCHGFEFHPFENGTLFDLMVRETKPEFVSFEIDVFWAQQGGADPAKLIEKYPTRFKLMHVKDLRKGAAINLTGGAPDEDSVAVGQGQVDWPAVLKAAEKAGLEHYFIEDEAKEAVDQIPQTLRYLERVTW
jgi:sugar phosphate isomerase/epimerase